MQRDRAVTVWGALLVLILGLIPGAAVAQVNQKLIEAGRRATVYVVIESGSNLISMGSGFCIDATGVFITNQHVVEPLNKDKNAKIFLVIAPGTKYQRILTPTVVKADAARDVAVLRVDRPGPLEPLELASPAAMAGLRETSPVVAFGFPLGQALSLKDKALPEITITTGRVSALRHDKGQLVTLQFDASVTNGNSGGPLIDAHGQVVGVVTAGIPGRQINFAGPVDFIRHVLATSNIVLTPRVLTNPYAAANLIEFLASDGEANRTAVPSDTSLKENQGLLKDVLSKEYADKTPAGRYNLALALLSKAAASKDDRNGRYAMLVEARETAIASADVQTAAYTAVLITEDYALSPADALRDVVVRIGSRTTQAQDAAWVSALGMMLCEAYAEREQYAEMRKLVGLVRSTGTASRNPTVAAQMRDRLPRLEAMAVEFDRVQLARPKLDSAPEDPEANLIVGRYVALTRGDLDKGVPMLAKGSDAALKALAIADLAKPTTPDTQKALGDQWWDQSAKEAKNPTVADLCKSRAGYWYLQAAPKLTGLTKTLVEKRLGELPAAPPAVAAKVAKAEAPPQNLALLRPPPPGRGLIIGELQFVAEVIRKTGIKEVAATGKDTLAKLDDPVSPLKGVSILVVRQNFWRDIPKEKLGPSIQKALTDFVRNGGDLIFFEQYAGGNMDIFETMFGVRGQSGPGGAEIVDPILQAHATRAGLTAEAIAPLRFHNNYTQLPEGSVVLMRVPKDQRAGVVVAPFGSGRLILIGFSPDRREQAMVTAVLEVVFGAK